MLCPDCNKEVEQLSLDSEGAWACIKCLSRYESLPSFMLIELAFSQSTGS
jgi:ribosomal protein L37AE/L43A